ncbi:YaaA family protein [Sphingomonas sp.]|uniref:YaaA family protein n=1 Tax=Sphingomonas sp. TaxID=28214 RepID=UPI003B002319
MIAVISPAKTLDYATALPPLTPTAPRFGEEAATLARSAARLPQKRLRQLMGISLALAKLNHDRFVGFADAPERPALYAFAGDVYHGLDVATLDEAAVAFAQDHLRMLSGLYGLLRPLDLMRPYRLEMGTHWAPRRAKLTDWWGDRIAATLIEDLTADGSATVLNLASNEYWAAVEGRLPDVRVISADFREGADRRFVSFNAKRARGAMARWLIEHRVATPDDMQAFDWEGYRYVADESEPDRWRFVRG